jgi:hypothetical protein
MFDKVPPRKPASAPDAPTMTLVIINSVENILPPAPDIKYNNPI